MMMLPCNRVWAAFGEDIEAPKPKFTQENGDWIAQLIPRGKSTSIKMRFHVAGGTLVSVALKEFSEKEMPHVDTKNFRSGFYMVEITPGPDGETSLSVGSDYFNTATELWGPKEKASLTWSTTGSANVPGENRLNTLTFSVRDGGALDVDGKTDGRITVILGPRDSFWGYAIGTLFIRFFGIFIVLAVLMAGMMGSGRIFEWIDNRKKPVRPAQSPGVLPAESESDAEETGEAPDVVSSALAAAVAIALHLHARTGSQLSLADSEAQATSSWSLTGRTQLMADRMSAFDRVQRN
jgi:hypothetical protein